jgi:hypothetical protein
VDWARATDSTKPQLAEERHGRDTTPSTSNDTDRCLSGRSLGSVLVRFTGVDRIMVVVHGLAKAVRASLISYTIEMKQLKSKKALY